MTESWNTTLKKLGSTLIFLSSLSFISFAQNTINSVYSRYGLGDLNRRGIGQSEALGGTGIGLRTPNYLNNLNPASYSSQDTMSFIFNLGLGANSSRSQTNSGSSRFNSANISHIIVGFPITKWLKMSSGLVPFSRSGYYIKEADRIPATLEEVEYHYQGSGGLNQFYGAASIAPFRFVSLGIQAAYVFGSLDHSVATEFPSSEIFPTNYYAWRTKTETHNQMKDLVMSYGLQLYDTLPGKLFVTAGFTYQPAKNLSATYSQITYNYISLTSNYPSPVDILSGPWQMNGTATLPASLGAGFSVRSKKVLFAADYFTQDWSKATFLGKSDSLARMSVYSAGIQFIPNPTALKNYLNKIQYRLGGYYGNTYHKLHGEQLKDYGMTFGFGLPYKNTNSVFDISFCVGQRGTLDNNLIKENYFSVTLNMSLYDYWFIKRKFN